MPTIHPSTSGSRQSIRCVNIASHQLLLLAEGTRAANYGAGFDYNFGMQFYGSSLKPIFTGSPVTLIDVSDSVEYVDASGPQQIARYLTNHDVDGSDGAPVTLFGGIPGSTAAFVVVALRKGVPFVYNGTEVAFPTAITFPFMTVTVDWTINPSVTAVYKQIIGFRNNSVAIRRGAVKAYDNSDVCAFTKTSGHSSALVLVNLRNTTVSYPVPAVLQNTSWMDGFAGTPVTIGTQVSLAPYQYIVLRN